MSAPDLHHPVLLHEAIAGLAIRPDGVYADVTYGRGGHTAALLAQLGSEGRLLIIDRDPTAIAHAQSRYGHDPRCSVRQANFARLAETVAALGWTGQVAGVCVDLGVSSPQLDDPERGFAFRHDGPLDMRMDPDNGPSAADWLAQASFEEIAGVLKTLGEERYARRIAQALVNRRQQRPVRRTHELAELIAAVVPTHERHKHPATRSFQAIRMHVNQELAALAALLAQTVTVLAPGGRLAAISFHSLEDRLVKRFVRGIGPPPPRKLPITEQGQPRPPLRPIGKPQRPSEQECLLNPRARSACLRIAERQS